MGAYGITQTTRGYGKFLGIRVYKPGRGYLSTQSYTVTHKIYEFDDSGNFDTDPTSQSQSFTANVDALGTLLVSSKGTNYSPSHKPSLTVTR